MRKITDSTKKAKGTHRKGREKEPITPPVLSEHSAPEQLSKDAKREWEEIAPTLSNDKLLTGLDRKMLMAYCEEMAKYWRYQRELASEDIILELKDTKGKVVNYMKNPKLDLSDRALTYAHKIGLHFGLTPLSRSKIGFAPKKESTPAEKNLQKLEELRQKAQMKVA